jgi:hypothetical protein
MMRRRWLTTTSSKPISAARVDLELDGRERRHPRDAAVAHLAELVFRHEEPVLDGRDAALDRVLDTFGPRRVGERLPSVHPGGLDDRADLLDRHLRRNGNPPLLR